MSWEEAGKGGGTGVSGMVHRPIPWCLPEEPWSDETPREAGIASVSAATAEVWLSFWKEREGRETREAAQRQL